MIYRITDQIFKNFPGFTRGVILAHHIDNTMQSNFSLEIMMKDIIEKIYDDDTIKSDHPRIQTWYDIYKILQADVKNYPPSIATMVKRIKRGKTLSFISPVVAIMNIISLSYLIPVGGIDLSKAQGNLILGTAHGDEVYCPLGKDEQEAIREGEVIYFDSYNKNVFCKSWNSRAGKFSIISSDTKEVAIDLDFIDTAISQAEAAEATYRLAKLVEEFCGGNTRIEILDKDRMEFLV